MKESFGMKGRFKYTKYVDGKEVFASDWQDNLIVSSNTYGRNLVARAMAGDTTYPVEVDGMVLSTNTTPPTVSDTAWGGTEILVPIQVPSVANNVIVFSAFFADMDLPNDTYSKIGLAIDGRIFSSALLDTPIVKDTGESYRYDYQITIN
jgi:hypothetical protein